MSSNEANNMSWRTELAHVAALTILDVSESSEITTNTPMLLGIRTNVANHQHKFVASVPTKRIPPIAFWDIANRESLDHSEAYTELVQGKTYANLTHRGNNFVTEAVETIMARKLGLGDALVCEHIDFEATAKIILSGISPKYTDDDVEEPLWMVNILVLLRAGKEFFPSSTASYDPIVWVTIGEFFQLMEHKSITLSLEDGVQTYTVGGFCTETSQTVLSNIIT